MAINFTVSEHNVAFPSKVKSGICGHTFNCYIGADMDNGVLVGIDGWKDYDRYTVKNAPAGFAGVIREQAKNGNWYVEVVNAGTDAPAIFIHQPVVVAGAPAKKYEDEKYFYNKAGSTVKGYELAMYDIIEESAAIFTGTPAAGKSVTWDASTKKFVVATS